MQAARERDRQCVAVQRRDLARRCFAERRLYSSANPPSLAIELPPLESEIGDDEPMRLAGKIAATENRRLATQRNGLAPILGGFEHQRIDDRLDDRSNAVQRRSIASSIGLLDKETGD